MIIKIIIPEYYNKNKGHGKLSFQSIKYNEFYKNNKFKWCAYIDCDEFIELLKWNSIKDMLNDEMFKNVNQICLYWKEIGDNDIIEAPDNYIYNNTMFKNITDINEKRKAILEWRKLPLSQRFPKYCNTESEPDTVKSIIKGYEYLINEQNNKKPLLNDMLIDIHITKIYNTALLNGYIINDKQRILNSIHYDGNHYNYGFIKHYRTLSLSEYLERKYNNKFNAFGECRHLSLKHYYYKINKETEDKNKYFNWFIHKYQKYNILYIYNDISLVKEDDNYKYILNGYNGSNAKFKGAGIVLPADNNIVNGFYIQFVIPMFDYVTFVY